VSDFLLQLVTKAFRGLRNAPFLAFALALCCALVAGAVALAADGPVLAIVVTGAITLIGLVAMVVWVKVRPGDRTAVTQRIRAGGTSQVDARDAQGVRSPGGGAVRQSIDGRGGSRIDAAGAQRVEGPGQAKDAG
jgi:hypothetical protein